MSAVHPAFVRFAGSESEGEGLRLGRRRRHGEGRENVVPVEGTRRHRRFLNDTFSDPESTAFETEDEEEGTPMAWSSI